MRTIGFIPFLALAIAIVLAGGGTAYAARAPQYAAGTNRGKYAKFIASARTCPGASSRSGSLAKQERIMRCLVNFARKRYGIGTVKLHSKLTKAARYKSADILRCKDWSHTACGRDSFFHMRRVGYISSRTPWFVSENLGWGSGSLGIPQAIMRGWLNSSGHRSNLFTRDWRQFGVGLKIGTMNGLRGAAVWTSLFGVTGPGAR
jgi:uncharacterized protein YkwD